MIQADFGSLWWSYFVHRIISTHCEDNSFYYCWKYHLNSLSVSVSIFIAMSKKWAANKCQLHRTSTLMSRINKLMIRILMYIVRRTRLEKGKEQRFFKDTVTRNAIFIIIIISISAQELFLFCFYVLVKIHSQDCDC